MRIHQNLLRRSLLIVQDGSDIWEANVSIISAFSDLEGGAGDRRDVTCNVSTASVNNISRTPPFWLLTRSSNRAAVSVS
ncbi:MAG: hypothetical protein KME27_00270 [Lyngbya sp. HA4199-MV5]|nr:hypothetical protein [Lyngbya sp. HA4199-MV5]